MCLKKKKFSGLDLYEGAANGDPGQRLTSCVTRHRVSRSGRHETSCLNSKFHRMNVGVRTARRSFEAFRLLFNGVCIL